MKILWLKILAQCYQVSITMKKVNSEEKEMSGSFFLLTILRMFINFIPLITYGGCNRSTNRNLQKHVLTSYHSPKNHHQAKVIYVTSINVNVNSG